MQMIIIATLVVGVIGLLIGIMLVAAGKAFYVEVDEREVLVRECLPGNNCGGCGYPGCDGLAAAIAKGEAPINACPVGGAPVAAKIAEVMGEEVGEAVRTTAFVKCKGDCEQTFSLYDYAGERDCKMVNLMQSGGAKSCSYGCLGFGNCVKVCPFDAIHIVNGIAKVDSEKCKSCGKCVAECPKRLIEIIPYGQPQVQCSSKDKGKEVMAACKAGCIGCKKCEKNCPSGAITVTDNVAHVDKEKCTGCGKCKEVCTRKCIF